MNYLHQLNIQIIVRCVRNFVIFDIELNILYISRNPEIVRPPIPQLETSSTFDFESEEEIIDPNDPKDPNYNPDISEPTRVRNIHKICQHKN